MLINRKSTRKGPKYSQIYVPHDQRQLNPPPRIIQTEKEAQNYYNQLQQMGYINIPPDSYEILQVSAQTDSTITLATHDNHPGIEYVGVGPVQVLHIGGQVLKPDDEYFLISGDVKILPSTGLVVKGGVDFNPPLIDSTTATSTTITTTKVVSCGYIPSMNFDNMYKFDICFLADGAPENPNSVVTYYPSTSCIYKIPAGGMVRVLHCWENK